MRNKILGLIAVLIAGFMTLTVNVSAAVVEAEENLIVRDSYNSSKFLFGNDVDVNANIDGIAFVAGNKVTTSAQNDYGFYAGNIVAISDNVLKDLFVAGNQILFSEDTIIGRDAYVAGNIISIAGSIGGTLRVSANTLYLTGVTINGNVYSAAEKIIMDETTVINGKFSYYKDTVVEGLDKATISETVKKDAELSTVESSNGYTVLNVIFSIAAGLIVLLALFAVVPSSKDRLDVKLSSGSVLKTIGIGFVALVIIPVLTIFGICIEVLMPLALIVLAVYVVALYLSFLFSGYVLGNAICKKFNNSNIYLAMLVGVIIVKLLGLIPVVGIWFDILFLLYGLGLSVNAIKQPKTIKK